MSCAEMTSKVGVAHNNFARANARGILSPPYSQSWIRPWPTIESNDSISYSVFSALSDDVESLCLVKECRALESKYYTNFTSKILLRDMGSSLRDMEKTIYVKDHILTLQVSHFNVLVDVSNTVGW